VLPKNDYKEGNVFSPDTKRRKQKLDTMTRQKNKPNEIVLFKRFFAFLLDSKNAENLSLKNIIEIRKTNRWTNKQTQKQIYNPTDKQAKAETNRQTEYKPTDKHTNRQKRRQTDIQTGKRGDKQTNRWTEKNRPTKTNRQTDKRADIWTKKVGEGAGTSKIRTSKGQNVQSIC
jgi:hypothetical protein